MKHCRDCGAEIAPDEQGRHHTDHRGREFWCEATHVVHATKEDCRRAVARRHPYARPQPA